MGLAGVSMTGPFASAEEALAAARAAGFAQEQQPGDEDAPGDMFVSLDPDTPGPAGALGMQARAAESLHDSSYWLAWLCACETYQCMQARTRFWAPPAW
jgi:hypothetical protein